MLEQVESSLWCAIFDSVVSIGLHLRDVAARLAAPASVLTAIHLLQAERENLTGTKNNAFQPIIGNSRSRLHQTEVLLFQDRVCGTVCKPAAIRQLTSYG